MRSWSRSEKKIRACETPAISEKTVRQDGAQSGMLDDTSTEEVAKKLEEFGLHTAGSKAVLRERLRKTLEGTNRTVEDVADNDALMADDAVDIDSMSRNELIRRLRQLLVACDESESKISRKAASSDAERRPK